MPYYRRNLYVLSATIFLASLSWNQIIPFLAPFLKDLGAERELLGWVGVVFALQNGASMLAQPFWGKLGDYYGRKPMVIRAGICLAGIYVGMSFCQAPWQLAALRFLNGALTGFIPGSFALIATNTPQQLAPRAVATAQSASAAGLLLGPAIGGILADLVGYRASMQIAGGAVLAATALVWWLVQEPNKPLPETRTSLAQDFVTAIRSPVMSSLMLLSMLAWAFGSAISPVLALYVHAISSVSDRTVGIVYALPAAAFVLTARRWTSLGERFGFQRMILAGLTGTALGTLLLPLASGVWAFGAIYFLTGIWLAALGPSGGAITCTLVDQGFRGRAYGMQQAAGTFAALITPLIATRAWTVFGMRSVFVLVGCVFLIGTVVFRFTLRRWDVSG